VTYLYVVGSVVLASTTLSSQWVVSRHKRWGWMILMIGDILGVPYEWITKQYGFEVVCLAGFVIAFRAFRSWGREEKKSCSQTGAP
jgi:hypothetical protein